MRHYHAKLGGDHCQRPLLVQTVLFARPEVNSRKLSEVFPQYRSVEKISITQEDPAPFLRGTRRKGYVYSGLGSNRCPIQDRSRLSCFYDAKNQQRRIRTGIHSAVRVVDVNVCFAEARSRASKLARSV